MESIVSMINEYNKIPRMRFKTDEWKNEHRQILARKLESHIVRFPLDFAEYLQSSDFNEDIFYFVFPRPASYIDLRFLTTLIDSLDENNNNIEPIMSWMLGFLIQQYHTCNKRYVDKGSILQVMGKIRWKFKNVDYVVIRFSQFYTTSLKKISYV